MSNLEFTIDEAMCVVDTAADGCHNHDQNITINKEDIDKVFWVDSGCNCGSESERKKAEAGLLPQGRSYGPCNSWCDSWSEAFFRLKNGKYVAANESADSTGHGCQCSGSIEIFDTKDEFLKLGIAEARVEIKDLIE